MLPRRAGVFAVVLSVALGLFGAAPAAARQDTPGPQQEYMALVEMYRSGQPDAAVERLIAEEPDKWLSFAGRLVKRSGTFVGGGLSSAGGFYRAASLMHAHASFRLWISGKDKSASAHFNLARALVDLSDRAGDTAPTFRPRWYLATSAQLTRLVEPRTATDYFTDAVERLPGNVPILTAAGWFSEQQASFPAAQGWSLRTAEARRRMHLEAAARHLTRALTTDPRAPEAALRLAHVESALGQEARAVERLTALVARDDLDRSLAYVAHLLLGGIRESEGRTTDAEGSYREAIALDPVAQSARVALAQLLHAAGDSTGAADAVEPMLSDGDLREGNDPWSDYRLAYPLVGQLIFEDLVAEVQEDAQ